MTLLGMSIFAAVLILAVVVIRLLAINRLPKKTFVILWSVVLCRLLIPFSIPSPLSVYTLVNRVGKSVITVSDFSGIDAVTAGAPFAKMQLGTMPAAAAAIPWAEIIWAVGFVACTLFFVVSYLLSRRKFQTAIPVKNPIITEWLGAHSIRRSVKVRQSDRIKTPLCYGIIYPVILLPKKMDLGNDMQLQYILTHEHTHIRHFDGVIKLLLTAALCVHWFNPMVWIMVILANRDIELSCDEAVVHAFGDTVKSAYARALICMEERKSGILPLCNNFSKNAIEERITAIMKTKKATMLSVLIACLLIVGMTTVFTTSATAAEADTKAEVTPLSGYSDWGVTYQNGVFYYENKQVRIFMDLNADRSFKNFAYNENGSVDLRLVRGNNGSIIKAEYIPKDKADEILSDLDISHSDTPGKPTADMPETRPTNDKAIPEDISRLTLDEAPGNVQSAIASCDDNTWYAIEYKGQQFIYYHNLPHNYAYRYEQSKNTLIILDIGKSTGAYVLLSVPLNSNLAISYNSKSVTYTKVAV